ncbi:M23 family metallopeptidase [Micromonospora sp. NPDC005203]|uniref:M23 family metallopeptidase n=1 Tax=Micromonospora sp. NPDC005203 TaxID=3364226 RepID=UPI003674E418
MPSPTISRRARPVYPILLLLAPVLAAGCATTRPGAPSDAAPTTPSAVWATADQAVSPTATPKATPTATGPARPKPSSASPSATAPRAGVRHVFPVRAGNVDYHPTHGAYPATDLFANCGEPFVAVTDGTVLEVSRVDRYTKGGPQGPDNGGLSVSLLGDDGVRYYGSHLSVVSSGVDAGVRVRAGQQLGKVGRTGNANNVCHVHFGISPPCKGKDGWWIRRGVLWPARYLDSWRGGGNREPAAEVVAWQRRNGCPKAP